MPAKADCDALEYGMNGTIAATPGQAASTHIRPRGVPLTVAGRSRVEAELLRRKLGDTAWYVLQQLWKLRAKDGETHVTNAGLSRGAGGFVKQSIAAVKRACLRLSKAGLLLLLGRRPRVVPRGRNKVSLQVVCRRVFGAPAEGALGAERFTFTPGTTARWLAAVSDGGQGGARTGAGRPVFNRADPHIQPGRSPGIQPGRRSSSSFPEDSGSGSLRTTFGDAADRVRAPESSVSVLSFGELPDPPGAPDEDHPEVAPREAVLASSDPGVGGGLGPPLPTPLGHRLEGAPRRPKAPVMPTSVLDGAPPLPWMLVGVATVPNPPNLEPDMRPTERAVRLADAYRGAVESRFSAQALGHAFRRGAISNSKHFELLLEAAQFMIDHELAPAAWAAWSCDIWKIHNTPLKPPPVAWVFGTKRLAERRGWFEAEEQSYLGGTVKYGPVQTALLKRYMSLRFAIHDAGAWDDPGPLVARYFPEDSYDRAVKAAQQEVKQTRERLREAADTGTFMW